MTYSLFIIKMLLKYYKPVIFILYNEKIISCFNNLDITLCFRM